MMTFSSLVLVAASVVLPPESFTRGEHGIWNCDLAKFGVAVEAGELKSGGWSRCPDYPALFFGVESMTLAREPDTGWFTFEGEDNVRVPDLATDGASFAGYWTHDWAFEVLRVDRVEDGVVHFKDCHVFGIGKTSWGQKKRRFYAVNHPSYLNAAGEWYLDRATWRLSFLPPGGAIDARPIRLVWGREPVLALKGERGVTIKGRTIAFGGGAGIELRDCHGVTLDSCVIECVAGGGIDIGGDCTDVMVTNCVIREVGRFGVALNGGDRRTLTLGNNRVVACEITRFARVQRVYAPGVALNGCGNAVVGCRIHDAPHSAIIYGGNEHLISGNDIWDVIKETGDAGALYTGRDWTSQGNVVSFNRIHDLGQSVADGASRHDVFTMGVYLDDCDCGDTVVSNVFERAGCAVMVGGGRDNIVRGNKMIDCDIGIHLDARGVTWTQRWNNPDDASWNLIAKAEALHYQEEPWKSRYPHLTEIMNDEPRLPKHNVFADNELVRCRIPYQFDTDAAVWAQVDARRESGDYGLIGVPDPYAYNFESLVFLNADALAACVSRYDRTHATQVAKPLLPRMRGMTKMMPTLRELTWLPPLFRYYESGLADEEMKGQIRTIVSNRVEWLKTCELPEPEWKAHENALLAAGLLATGKITGDESCKARYEAIADQALANAWEITRYPEQRVMAVMHPLDFNHMNAALEVIHLADPSRANRAEALMKEVAKLAAQRLTQARPFEKRFACERQGEETQSFGVRMIRRLSDGDFAGDLVCAVAMISKIERIDKVLGAELNTLFARAVDRLIYGLDGVAPPWESTAYNLFPLLDAKARLGK